MHDKKNFQLKFLALTGLQEYWDISKPMLFLGDWCHPFYKDPLPSSVDAQFLNHPDLKNIDSMSSVEYTIQIYEEILPIISNWLNKQHNINYSLQFWRIVSGPFLLLYIQTLYRYYKMLRVAYGLYPDIETIGLDSSSFITPADSREFTMLCINSHEWNLQLFSQILMFLNQKNFSTKKCMIKRQSEQNDQGQKFSAKTKFKIKLLFFYTKMIGKKAIIANHEDSFSFFFKSKFRIVPILLNLLYPSTTMSSIDIKRRTELGNMPGSDEFSKLIFHTLQVNLPVFFLEGYDQELKIIKKIFPQKARAVISGILHDRIQLWAALLKERSGTKLIGEQHGGHYGMGKFLSSELLEKQNTDYYLTWGWKDSNSTIPAPLGLQKYHTRNIRIPILFLPARISAYDYMLGTNIINGKQSYIELQKFIHHLSEDTRKQVVMRLRPGSSAKEITWYKKNIPVTVSYSNDRGSFTSQLLSSNIFVSDHMQTTFLWALAYNIPTIIYWKHDFWPCRETAKPHFDLLNQVGIYHGSPESAAAHLNLVANDPTVWWNSVAVQEARKKFCFNFVRTSDTWIKERCDIILKIADN